VPARASSIDQADAAEARLREKGLIGHIGPEETKIANDDMVRRLTETTRFVHRGVWYKVEPLPFETGLYLQRKKQELFGLLADNGDELLANSVVHLSQLLVCMEAIVKVFWLHARPVKWWMRPKYVFRNPFTDVSEVELMEILGFFFFSRMRSRSKFLSPERKPTPARA
jgi:hypothetical protein